MARSQSAALPDFIPPELAMLVDQAPAGEDWIHEIKLDGYRTAARLDSGKVRIIRPRSRKGRGGQVPGSSARFLSQEGCYRRPRLAAMFTLTDMDALARLGSSQAYGGELTTRRDDIGLTVSNN